MEDKMILLAKHGIIESNNEYGKFDVQRIDDPESFAELNQLNFIPPKLQSDEVAKILYYNIINLN